MIVHDRERADGDGEDMREFLESMFDPFSAVDRAFAEQENATHAAGDAVMNKKDMHRKRDQRLHCSARPVLVRPEKRASDQGILVRESRHGLDPSVRHTGGSSGWRSGAE